MGGFEWGEKDHLLTFAYTLYLAGMCDCGYPRHICQHPDNDGWFTAKTKICQSKAAIDQVTGAKGYKPEPGQMLYAVYERPADKPLPPLEPQLGSGGEPNPQEDHADDSGD